MCNEAIKGFGRHILEIKEISSISPRNILDFTSIRKSALNSHPLSDV